MRKGIRINGRIPPIGDGWAEEKFSTAYRAWIFDKMDGEGYSILMDYLYDVEFTWCIPQDANRASAGIGLRADFEYDSGISCPSGWDSWPCSLLEMMVSLAFTMERMLYWEPDGENNSAADWFWEMCANSGLARFDDEYIISCEHGAFNEMEETVENILERRYCSDGSGGFFPLKHPAEDQRYVEIWYQMNAYAMEH